MFVSSDVTAVKAQFVVTSDSQEFFVMSEKRAGKKHKDGKKHHGLEFLGGRVDADEEPLSALLRELAEEDSSGELAQAARNQTKSHHKQDIRFKDGTTTRLYQFTLDPEAWMRIEDHFQNYPKKTGESFGLVLISKTSILRGDHHLTPKTKKILEKMK